MRARLLGVLLRDYTVPTQSLPDFVPPPRFGTSHFSSYQPQHPSQKVALETTQGFIATIPLRQTGFLGQRKFFWHKKAFGKGLYLDGGFGVGKTHLLASAYDAFGGTKSYLSFSELVYVIGSLGKEKALEQFGQQQLYCIDEFELDDPGNTLIVKTFLSYVFARGAQVITTSNTPPEAQGQGRFNAKDFQREIQSMAQHFQLVVIGGPDYRKRDQVATLLSPEGLETLYNEEKSGEPKVKTSWSDLFSVLAAHHPIRYGGVLKQLGTLYIENAQTIPGQNEALRFVHFIDKLYDLKVGLRMSGGLELSALFDVTYRNSAYAKKHYRCLSRISELLESRAEG
ncbi:MAG: cell division protein ZapE [Trueperaceae bacterium]